MTTSQLIALSTCFTRCSVCSCVIYFPYRVAGRRGRDASYPTPPAQIPACGFPAPGSSVRLASAIPVAWEKAIPLREVGWCAPALHVRHQFPVRAASHRHPLPHVDGSPALRVLRGDPTPHGPSAILSVTAYLCPGIHEVSQVPDASLHAYHALGGPRQTLGKLTKALPLCRLLGR